VNPFTVVMGALTRLQIEMKSARTSDSVLIPTWFGPVETMTYGDITMPVVDVDGYDGPWQPYFTDISAMFGVPPNHVVDPLTLCMLGPVMFALEKGDWLDSEKLNQWSMASVGPRGKYPRPKDWVEASWFPYNLSDGTPVWPKVELDFAQLFLKADMWDDGLERAIAFSNIGTHRIEVSDKEFGGEQLPFVVKLNGFAALDFRPGFARYCGDMYFSEAGMPVLLITPSGIEITKGSKDWQYWKFVWRSSLASVITLLDHLNLAHYRVANNLATASRAALSPSHPVRRVMSVFTFGTISINYVSMSTLTMDGGALSQVLPLGDYKSISTLVPSHLVPPITQSVEYFANKSALQELPKTLREAPFYADGVLVYEALQRLVAGYFDIFRDEWCDAQDDIRDPGILKMTADLFEAIAGADYKLSRTGVPLTCADAIFRTTANLYLVTAYHRHVGQVGDLALDPEVAAFSWKEGESAPRPMQAFITTTIAAATGVPQPKLIEDYSHVFKGMHRETEAKALWAKFRTELQGISDTVEQRNKDREVPYYRADPKIVECSLAI